MTTEPGNPARVREPGATGLLVLVAASQVAAAIAVWRWWPSAAGTQGYVGLAAYLVTPMVLFGVMAGLGWAVRRRVVPSASPVTQRCTGTVQAAAVAVFVLCTVLTVLVVVLVLPALLVAAFVFEGIG